MLKVNGLKILYKTYSDGSLDIRIPSIIDCLKPAKILAGCTSPEDTIALIMLLQHFEKAHVDLLYLPFARQDREQDLGSHKVPNLVSLFASILEAKAHSITLHDPHSSVIVKVVPSLQKVDMIVETQASLLLQTVPKHVLDTIDMVLVPDAGAKLKCTEISKMLGKPLIQLGEKTRNPDTKEISIKIDEGLLQLLEGKNILICDDIIDYGSTVRELTEYLRKETPVGAITLFTSHAILPLNTRLETPSRFDFALEFVDQFYTFNLFDYPYENEYFKMVYNNLI